MFVSASGAAPVFMLTRLLVVEGSPSLPGLEELVCHDAESGEQRDAFSMMGSVRTGYIIMELQLQMGGGGEAPRESLTGGIHPGGAEFDI